MNQFKRKVTIRVLGIHLGVVAILMLQSCTKGCFRPKPKPEIVTFIEFGSPAPAVNVQEVTQMADPEPVKPTPAPTPEPTVVPEPVKKTVELPKPKPKPKPTPKPEPKPEPKPKPTPKPKWKPTKVDVSKSTRIEPTKPAVSATDIERELSGIVGEPTASTPGNPNEFAAYDAKIYAAFYSAWRQPAANAARPAKVSISIQSNGRITTRSLSQGSGDPAFDKTVMDAVNSVSLLPKPPDGYPLNNIVVQFRVDG